MAMVNNNNNETVTFQTVATACWTNDAERRAAMARNGQTAKIAAQFAGIGFTDLRFADGAVLRVNDFNWKNAGK